MNRHFIAISLSTLLAAGTMGSASANTGVITFTGAISSSTCNMNVVVNGVTSPTAVVDLGVWQATDATAVGSFGNPVDIALVPDISTCSTSPAGSNAMLNVQSAQTDETNTNVVTNADTATTNVGVLFQLASGTSVVNTGSVSLTSGGGDLDNTGSIHFKAQPYAVAATIAPGIIGGVVTYTVAYL